MPAHCTHYSRKQFGRNPHKNESSPSPYITCNYIFATLAVFILLCLSIHPAAPFVGSAFLLSKVQPGQQVIQLNPQDSAPSAPVQVVLNTVSQYLVNCKGMGKPRATLVWTRNGALLQNVSNTVRVDPKQGTGYLNVSVSSTDAPSCTTYTCLANNVAGTSSGSVTVCTQSESFVVFVCVCGSAMGMCTYCIVC